MSAPPSPLVSVVVPALDEAERIGAALTSVLAQSDPFEIIVSDGGSTDDTLDLAAATAPTARLVSTSRGRARQMNAGAQHATGDVLLFLHADTRLPLGALDAVRSALEDESVIGGCFRTTFALEEAGTPRLGPVGRAVMSLWEARLWMGWHRLAFGDRALFVRRADFEDVGGFPEQPIFEDLDMVRRIRPRGRFAFLDLDVVTSARRFRRHGAVRQQLRNLGLWAGWNVGLSPDRLKRFYSDRDRG
ncbi:TIGR04283 family arsenosugar biosynthesis glycosyltransferase [Rubrivirga sp.]|uniref:TIGR04283 family arsenosugar biosynthesis glycosyltransferase n=1 Tax=Rubrivirga sp. TaxID=1885344 RepID=UPI003C793F17